MFCKLIKWSVIAGVATVATGFFLFGTHAPSYAAAAFGSVRESVKGQIPVEFELDRARQLIAAIDPEIEDCKRDVARAEVELDGMSEDIRRLEREVARGQRKLTTHREMLKDNQGNVFTINGVTYSRRELMLDLERSFDAVRSNEALLAGKKALVDNQTKAVAAARSRLDAVRGEKARLEDSVEALAAQKRKMDALAVTSCKFSLDTKNLAKAKELLAEVKKRLDVSQKMLQSDVVFSKGIAVEETHPRTSLMNEVEGYLRGDQGNEETPTPAATTGR